LNLKVIAEGVEPEQQLQLLQLLKCDEIQGYIFSPAVPPADVQKFLAD
jgi:EAL domain-containing protein (putative c-di-GMP-specific phosphodiesterase class I)